MVTEKDTLLISSYCQAVALDGKDPVVIGERINPTGKKKLQAALRAGDTGYVLNQALQQEEAGAHILDVNVGLPDLDEPVVLTKTIELDPAETALDHLDVGKSVKGWSQGYRSLKYFVRLAVILVIVLAVLMVARLVPSNIEELFVHRTADIHF